MLSHLQVAAGDQVKIVRSIALFEHNISLPIVDLPVEKQSTKCNEAHTEERFSGCTRMFLSRNPRHSANIYPLLLRT